MVAAVAVMMMLLLASAQAQFQPTFAFHFFANANPGTPMFVNDDAGSLVIRFCCCEQNYRLHDSGEHDADR